MMLRFTKYHGLGNDFILVDGLRTQLPSISIPDAIRLCNRHFGIGADGVIVALPAQTPDGDCRMHIVNSDGSVAEMCGNGLRCLARFLWDERIVSKPDLAIETLAGTLRSHLRIEDGRVVQVSVEMGKPLWKAHQVPTTLVAPEDTATDTPLEVDGAPWVVTAINMRVPHCIVFVPDVEAVDWVSIGPRIEHHPAFPQKTNVMFTQVLARDQLRVRPWERGAGATLACGTGACAAAVAAAFTGRADAEVSVTLPGGTLHVDWNPADDNVTMAGPAERVFTGQICSV